ncbi:MAG TPA: hypothetical protein VF407_01155, partial [Polyangiaceae bacterium]
MRASFVVLASALFFCASNARADLPNDEDEALPCRPTIACTAQITKPGTSEIELGALSKRTSDGRSLTTPFLLKFTLEEWLQIQVADNGFTHSTGADKEDFFDEVSFGAKIHLAKETTFLPEVSLSAELAVPSYTGQPNAIVGYDAFFTGYATKNFGPVEADLNVGVTEFGIAKNAKTQGWSALALSLDLNLPVGVMGEIYEFTGAAPFAPRDAGALFAV